METTQFLDIESFATSTFTFSKIDYETIILTPVTVPRMPPTVLTFVPFSIESIIF